MKSFFLQNQITALILLLLSITMTLKKCPRQKHLRIVLDLKLNFLCYVDQKCVDQIFKINRKSSI